MRFVYFYLVGDQPDAVRDAAPEHASYWRGMRLANDLVGPFADRSGGLITFDAASPAEAERLVANDPFPQRGLIEQSWIKEWKL